MNIDNLGIRLGYRGDKVLKTSFSWAVEFTKESLFVTLSTWALKLGMTFYKHNSLGERKSIALSEILWHYSLRYPEHSPAGEPRTPAPPPDPAPSDHDIPTTTLHSPPSTGFSNPVGLCMVPLRALLYSLPCPSNISFHNAATLNPWKNLILPSFVYPIFSFTNQALA